MSKKNEIKTQSVDSLVRRYMLSVDELSEKGNYCVAYVANHKENDDLPKFVKIYVKNPESVESVEIIIKRKAIVNTEATSTANDEVKSLKAQVEALMKERAELKKASEVKK